MLGDLRILATDDELLLDTERSSLQELFNMIRRFSIGYEAVLHKRTLERGLLSLVGPGSDAVAGVAGRLSSVEHSHQPVTIGGVPARAIRTDLGVDLLVEAESTEALRAALAAARAEAVAEEAAECLRVEHGRPRYGIDLDDSVIPQEAGLNSRAVSFTKGCYVGQETVARLFYRGKPNRRLRGLRSAAVLEPGAVLLAGEREVGRVTSVVDSPRLGPIALGFVRREVEPGAVVHVGSDGLEAEVVELPFGGAGEVA
jgi:tRNA-modifying protein YgfZ